MRKPDYKKAPVKTARPNPAAKPASKSASKPVSKQVDLLTLLSLIICFPAGLYVMWTNSRMPRAAKSAVTMAVCAVLLAILLPVTNPPEREMGGIYMVDETPCAEIQGPEAPADRQVIEIYAPRYTAIILEPTPTPVPVVVYCNNGGAHYHSAECKYVNEKTPDVSLNSAILAGYTQCTECNAPSPY